MNFSYTLPIAVGVALLAFAQAGCSHSETAGAKAAALSAPEPVAVRVAAVASRSIGRTAAVTGSIEPDETVALSAEVSGRIAAIHFDFGQAVRKGDVIAEIDKQEFALQRDRARAALGQALARIGLDPEQTDVRPESTPAIRQAKAQMEEARFKYENAAKLVKTGDISQERYVELEKQYHARDAAYQAASDDLRVALANIAALRAEVKLAEKRLRDATIVAPFDAAIERRMVAPGQYVTPNTPIVNLVKASPLRLRVEIPESAASHVKIGTPLTFTTDAAPGTEFRAVVSRLNPSLESRSRSLKAEARLSDPDRRLRPGMFVTVRLALLEEQRAAAVPHEALYQIAGLTKVFAVRNGRAVEVRVTPGAEVDGMITVDTDRIQPGDTVAVSNVAMLTDGTPVTVAGPAGARAAAR